MRSDRWDSRTEHEAAGLEENVLYKHTPQPAPRTLFIHCHGGGGFGLDLKTISPMHIKRNGHKKRKASTSTVCVIDMLLLHGLLALMQSDQLLLSCSSSLKKAVNVY